MRISSIYRKFGCVVVALGLWVSAVEAKTKIVIIAGEKSHPSGQHEFAAGSKLLAKALNEQSGLDVEAVVVTDGWPRDAKVFEGAKAVICYADGGPRHPYAKHLTEVDELAKKGVGLMFMHYAVEVIPGEAGEKMTQWIGGYYEGGHSVNPHWDATLTPKEGHAIGRGLKSLKVHDELYFNIKFPEPVVTEALVTATPERGLIKRYIHWNPKADEVIGKKQTLMWGLKRKDGGRGVGFTGGHWHRNWAMDEMRTLVLNAIVWVAGMEVPETGVKSQAITEEQLNQNLDAKEPMVKVKLPSPEDFNLPVADPGTARPAPVRK